MTILLHKPYLIKVTTKGEGVKNTQKIDHVVYGWPLTFYVKFQLQIIRVKVKVWPTHDISLKHLVMKSKTDIEKLVAFDF